MGCRYSYWEGYRRWYRDSGIDLYRDPAHGRVAGVCAGIAEALGVRPFAIRLATVVAFFVVGPFAILAYIAAAIALPVRDAAGYGRPAWAEKFDWDRHLFTRGRERREERRERRERRRQEKEEGKSGYRRPDVTATLDSLHDRLRGLDKRVASIEAYVASNEFTLARAIRNLEE